MKALTILLSAALFATPLFALDYASYTPSADPSAVLTSVWSDINSRGFAWQTDLSVSSGAVALVEGVRGADDASLFDASALNATATVTSVEDAKYADPAVNIYTAHIENLTPGATYSYRLGAPGHYAYGTFTVKSSQRAVTILNMNDAQTKDATLYPLYENALAAAVGVAGGASAYDFVLQGGDFYDGILRNAGDRSTTTDNTKLYNQWGMAVDTSTPYLPGVPWIFSSGNHDNAVSYGKRLAVAEDFKVNCDTYMGCHSFDCGNVHIATVHYFTSNWAGNEGRFERIFSWLEKDLAAAKADSRTDWTVVAMHAGPYTTGDNMRGGSNYSEGQFTSNLVMRIGLICSTNHVDLVLQAHDHTYSKTKPYRWDALGHTFSETDSEQINLNPETVEFAGTTYDICPAGTYYISAGCSGHRVGENSRYADRNGERSYANRKLKVVTGVVNVDSAYANKGDDASEDVGKQMFGVLRVNGKRLTYDFYVAEPNGGATLYDSFGILKDPNAAIESTHVDFSELSGGTTNLDLRANDRGEVGSSVSDRYWSYSGLETDGLKIVEDPTSESGRMLKLATGDEVLWRNLNPLTSLDPLDELALPAAFPARGSLVYETTVKFVRSNELPSEDVIAEDQFALGVYGDGSKAALYAFAGYRNGDQQEMRAFRLKVAVDDDWLSAWHAIVVRAFPEAVTGEKIPGFLLELDGRRVTVAGVAPIEHGLVGTEAPAVSSSYLGSVALNAPFAAVAAWHRLVLGLRPTGSGLQALGFEGSGSVDEIALSQRAKDSPTTAGIVLVVR